MLPRPSLQGAPTALPYSILRCLSSTSQSRAALYGRNEMDPPLWVVYLCAADNSPDSRIRVVCPTTADNYFIPKTGYNAPNSTCFGGGTAMVSHLLYYQFAVLVLAWLFVMLHVTGS